MSGVGASDGPDGSDERRRVQRRAVVAELVEDAVGRHGACDAEFSVASMTMTRRPSRER